MSIKTEIVRITTNVNNAYNAAEQNGATMPSVKNSANLASTVQQLVKPTGVLEITENNEYDVTNYASVEVNVESGPSGGYDIEQVTLEDGTCELKITDAAGGSGGGIDAAELGVFNVDLEKYPNFPVGGSYTYYYKLSNDQFLYSTSATNGGVWLCNRKTGEVEQLWSTGYLNGNFLTLSNGDIITPLATAGILYYHKKTKTFEQLDATAKNIDHLEEQWNGDVLMSSWNNNGSAGLRWYSAETHTITKVPSSSSNFANGVVLQNGDILFSGRQMSGLYLYSKETNTTTQLNTTNKVNRFILLDNGNVLMSSEYSSTTGLWLYDASTTEVTTLLTERYDWKSVYKLPDGKYLVSGATYGGVRLYNPDDNSITKTAMSSNSYEIFIDLPDGTILCFGSANSGVVIYDYSNNTVIFSQSYVCTPLSKDDIMWFDNNDMFFYGRNTSGYYVYGYFSIDQQTIKEVMNTGGTSSGKYTNGYVAKRLSNNNVELYGGANKIDYVFEYDTKTLKKLRWTMLLS